MKSHKSLLTALNLHLFDGEGGGAGEGAAPASVDTKVSAGRSPLADVQYGKQEPSAQGAKEPETVVTSDTAQARAAEFEKLIKGEYKDLYDKRVQQNISARFKEMEGLKSKAAQADALTPVLDMLAAKYGVDGANVDAVVKAIQEDDSYYESEATEKGVSVEQLKYVKRMERENAEFKRMAAEREKRQAQDQAYAMWQQQSGDFQKVHPGFDFEAECAHPETGKRFVGLLGSGVDVRTAFEVIHKDELMGGAMQYAANAMEKKVVNDIRARGMRPPENGGSGNGAAVTVKSDPRALTKKDREEISRRVMRGERISF